MPKFIVTDIQRYEVEASDETQALAFFHIEIEGVPYDLVGLDTQPKNIEIEYLDGTTRAENA